MEINETISKQITETSYLITDNTKRYRPILRFFYEQYERINYMLYKEDIWNELKNKTNFENYTIEMCENDLSQLVTWGNLTALQDTDNVSTVEEFIGYKLIVNPYVIKMEKIPGKPQAFMGIESFNSKLEYVFLCLILIYLEERTKN